MSAPDTYRDAFLAFVAQGMTYAEALAQFEEKEWRDALVAELDDGIRVDPSSGEIVTNDARFLPSLLALSSRAGRQESDTREMQKAYQLYGAGWTSEVPECFRHNSKEFWRQCPVMSFYWRAPSQRPGKPGRRYLSTNQAWNALQRSHEK